MTKFKHNYIKFYQQKLLWADCFLHKKETWLIYG